MAEVAFSPPIVAQDFVEKAARQAVIALHHERQILGGLVIGCPGSCQCAKNDVDVVASILAQAVGTIRRVLLQEDEIRDLQDRIEISAGFSGIVGKDPKMQLVYKLIEDIAPTDATVLIQGDSGTGKELVARAIHQQSPRSNRLFV